ncbi:MAG TPA: VWA domain-containing protein [Thermoanaerobaculia bacterium]
MSKRDTCPCLLLVSLFISLLPAQIFADGEGPAMRRSASWLEEVDPLVTHREREMFLGLHAESEREAFIQGFWQARDPYPQTSRNELKEQWENRMLEVQRRWGTSKDDRARVFLLQGEPSSSFEASCPQAGTFEVWTYEPQFREKHRSVLVFWKNREKGPVRLWRPGPESPELWSLPAESCSNGQRLGKEAQWLRWMGKDNYQATVERVLSRPRPKEWVSTFNPFSVEAPEGSRTFSAGMDTEIAGRLQEKVVVRVLMSVSPTSLPPARSSGPEAVGNRDEHEFELAGQVLREGAPHERFLYRFRARPRIAAAGQPIPLVFERYLSPGRYTLEVKLEHLPSQSFFLEHRDLEVPELQMASAPPAEAVPTVMHAVSRPAPPRPEAPDQPEVALAFAEADSALSASRPGLRLLVPREAVLSGLTRFAVRLDEGAEGAVPPEQRIERVAFSLDGKRLLTRNKPPYEVTIDLGPVPRPQKLAVEGLGPGGEVVARDELAINAGAQRFRVRLAEPRPGKKYRRSLRALAEIEAPQGSRVERVEMYLGEDRVATLYQPPYSQPILLPEEGEVSYVRAVAYLAGGGSSEDLVLLNAPEQPDAMEVNLVELYATLTDGQGRPVMGDLGPQLFQVDEDGVRQQIRRVDRADSAPLRLVSLLDHSASMRSNLAVNRQAALEFFRHTLRPQDQAAVIAFNRSPQVTAPLTNDLATLEEGLGGLLAEDDTSLYDSIVYSLYYLTGARGQRAVLVLSDGVDRSSRFSFEQTVELARRAGITVYTIGLALSDGERGEAARKLRQIAEVTGGRSFFAEDPATLSAVYTEIERELRSQYRISYQSSNTEPDGEFRTVAVKVAKNGLEARTISGYYP